MGITVLLNVLSNSVLSLRFVNVLRISMRQHAERDIVLPFRSACLFVTLCGIVVYLNESTYRHFLDHLAGAPH